MLTALGLILLFFLLLVGVAVWLAVKALRAGARGLKRFGGHHGHRHHHDHDFFAFGDDDYGDFGGGDD